MKTIRLYSPENYQIGSIVELTGDAFHHGIKVLRCRVGDQLELFDGNGGVAFAEIIKIEKRSANISINQLKNLHNESPLRTTLVQGVAKGERMDWVLQKATELGVSVIQPIITQRCNIQMNSARWQKRLLHWQRIIISACEQSGRNHLPELKPVINFEKFLLNCEPIQCYLLNPEQGIQMKNLSIDNSLAVSFMVGPEGGFTEEEIQQAGDKKIKYINLGPRILRTETAGISVLAIAQSLWGDI